MTRHIGRKLCAVVVAACIAQLTVGCLPLEPLSTDHKHKPPYGLAPTDTTSPGVTVGETPFSHAVSADGQAQVTVPLWSPPGRGGLQPQLALTYSSNGGQGVFGQGWGLSGMSRIEPCRKNPAQDGTYAGGWGSCLDGQRLVQVSTGPEFRAEVNGFDKIVAHPNDPPRSSDEWYEVKRRDGLVAEYKHRYGRSSSLTRLADRSGNHIDYIYPQRGLDEKYPRLDEIRYGTTSVPRKLVFQYELRPDRRHQQFALADTGFTLLQRVRQIDVMGPGVLSHANFAPAAATPVLLKSYKFTYVSGIKASRLESIKECDGAGVCKAPLIFTYAPETLQFEEIDLGITGLPITSQMTTAIGHNSLDFADVNGDGLDDVVYRNSPISLGIGGPIFTISGWFYRLTGPTGVGAEQSAAFPASTIQVAGRPLQFVNLNRDERAEVLVPSFTQSQGNTNTTYRAYAYGTSQAPNGYAQVAQVQTAFPFLFGSAADLLRSSALGDVNGDGRPDAIIKTGCTASPTGEWCNLALSYNTGGATVTDVNFSLPKMLTYYYGGFINTGSTPILTRADSPLYVVDLDGDGVNELLVKRKTRPYPDSTNSIDGFAPNLYAYEPSTSGDSPSKETQMKVTGSRVFGDFNGDGLVDSVRLEAGVVRVMLNLNSSYLGFGDHEGLSPIAPALSPAEATNLDLPNEVRVADLTGDGMDDLLLVSTMTLLASDGVGGFSKQRLTVCTSATACRPITPGLDSVDAWDVSTRRRFEQLLDYNGDGLADISLMRGTDIFSSGRPNILKRRGPPAGLLQSISGGISTPTVSFIYDSIRPNAAHYQPSTSCTYPQVCVKKGLWVVTEVIAQSSNPAIPHRFTYSYADGRVDVTGRGWLGFKSRTVTNVTTGHQRTTTFDNVTSVASATNPDVHFYPNAFQPESEVERIDARPDGVTQGVVSEARTEFVPSWSFAGVAQVGNLASRWLSETRLTLSEATANGPTIGTFGALVSTRWATGYDRFGNVNYSRTESFDGAFTPTGGIPSGMAVRKNLQITVFEPPDVANWLVSRAQRSEVSSTEPARPGVAERTVTRKTGFTWEPGSMLLKTVETEPCTQPCTEPAESPLTSGFNRKVTLSHDVHGNVIQVKDEASQQTRTTDIAWDTLDSTFPFTETNALGHVRTFYYHSGLGQLAIADSAIGSRIVRSFDGFGRIKAIDRPTAADSAFYYGMSGGLLKVSASTAGSVSSSRLFDRFGQVQKREWTGFNGSLATKNFIYDREGRLTDASVPFYAGEAPGYVKNSYDRLGRLISSKMGVAGTTYRYEGLNVTVEDADGHVTRVSHDGAGRLTSSTAFETETNRQVVTRHEYAPFNLLEKIVDPKGNETSIQYDVLGRRIALTDANVFAEGTLYNGYGELKRAVDGTATVQTYTYDDLGRIKSVAAPAGVDVFFWDTAPNGRGQLSSSTSADGIDTSYEYDALGRQAKATWSLPRASYAIENEYDEFGRLSQLKYPRIGSRQFRIRLAYTGEGALSSITDSSVFNFNGPLLWNQVAVNARGQSEVEEFGNGVTSKRVYDGHQRLQYLETESPATLYPYPKPFKPASTLQKLILSYTRGGMMNGRIDPISGTTEDFQYDFLNRLQKWTVFQNCQKSELVYFYDDVGNVNETLLKAGFGESSTYGYGGTNAGPQAVTSYGPTGGAQSTYAYLPGGLQFSAPGRTVMYTSFQLPKRITSSTNDTAYSYDANHTRVLKSSTAGTSTTYVGEIYEKRASSGSNLHVFSVGGMIQVEWPETGGVLGSPRIAYLHTDHLGTPETVTGPDGAVLEKMKFDPFGQRRHASALAYPASLNHSRGIGFTGHEPDDEFKLINMRGRIYDPNARRFLTPDPLVHSVASSQALNRYSYVANNPINFTDPTGFQIGVSGSYGTSGSSNSYSPFGGIDSPFYYSSARRSNQDPLNPPKAQPPNWGGNPVVRRVAAPDRSDSAGSGVTSHVVDSAATGTRTGPEVQGAERAMIHIGDDEDTLSRWLRTALEVGEAFNTAPERAERLLDDAEEGLRSALGLPAKTWGRCGIELACLAIPVGWGKLGPRAMPAARINVTEKGIARIEAHLKSLDALNEPANVRMVQRLKAGMSEPHDVKFYLHELKESAFMKQGLDARGAHLKTLEWQKIPYAPGYESKLYHSDVIREFKEYFNPAAHP